MGSEITLVLNRERFTEGLRCVGIPIPKRGALIQQFKCVRFLVQDRRFFLQTMGTNQACDYMFKELLPEGTPDLNGAVEYSKLFYTLAKSKKETVTIIWDPEKQSFKMTLEGVSRLNVLPTENWQEAPRDKVRIVRDMVSPDELKEAWSATSFTITPDITRYDLRGILYDGDWVTSNGHYISIFKVGAAVDDRMLIGSDFSSFISLVSSTSLKIESIVMRAREDRQLIMVAKTETGTLRYTTALSNAKFPDWRILRDKLLTTHTKKFRTRRAVFAETLSRVAAFVDKHRVLLLDLLPSELQITARSFDTAENTVDKIPLIESVNIEEQPLSILLNYDMLWNVSNENREEELVFNYGTDGKSVLLSVGDKEYIVAATVET